MAEQVHKESESLLRLWLDPAMEGAVADRDRLADLIAESADILDLVRVIGPNPANLQLADLIDFYGSPQAAIWGLLSIIRKARKILNGAGTGDPAA